MQLLVAIVFNYIQVMAVYNKFGEDVDLMICYSATWWRWETPEPMQVALIARKERLFTDVSTFLEGTRMNSSGISSSA
jgi:hypothetical protein